MSFPVPAEVPHLSSPDNPNPGTTTDRAAVTDESPNVSYLKEIWHAIQTQDVTGKDALLALTQRPLTTPDALGEARRRTCPASSRLIRRSRLRHLRLRHLDCPRLRHLRSGVPRRPPPA